MSKYIDTEKLMSFFKKKLESYKSKIVDPSKYPIDHIDLMALLASEYQALIFQLESFFQEQPEMDLEKEIERVVEYYNSMVNGSRVMKPSGVEKIARHFYELGLKTRKEENK